MAQVTTGGESEPIVLFPGSDSSYWKITEDPFIPKNTVRLVTRDHWKMYSDWLPPITAPAEPLYRKLAHRLGSWLLSI